FYILAKRPSLSRILQIILFGAVFGTPFATAQTFQAGGGLSGFASYLFRETISFSPSDTQYVFSGGYGGGLMAAFYFDHGGYYHRRIYGIKAEANYATHNQSVKIYPGPGPAHRDSFYMYQTRLRFIDVPLMFSFCPTHHNG